MSKIAHFSVKWAKLLTSACSLAPDGSWISTGIARHQWWKFYHESDTVHFPYQVSSGPHQRPSQKTFATPPSSIHRHHGSSGELNLVKDRHFSTNRLETCFILSGASHLPCLLFTVLIHHVLMKQRGPFGCQRRHGGVQHHRMDYVSFFLFGLPCEKSHVETLVGFYNGFFGNPILPSFSWPTSIFVETLVGFYSPSPKPPWRTTVQRTTPRYSEYSEYTPTVELCMTEYQGPTVSWSEQFCSLRKLKWAILLTWSEHFAHSSE